MKLPDHPLLWYTSVVQQSDIATLKLLATKYVWWKSPEEELNNLPHLLAQVFNLGTWNDAQALLTIQGRERCCELLAQAPAGMLNARSWNFWHIYLGIEPIPELPKRTVPN